VVEHRYSGEKGITKGRGRGRRALTPKAKAIEATMTKKACPEILIVSLINEIEFQEKIKGMMTCHQAFFKPSSP